MLCTVCIRPSFLPLSTIFGRRGANINFRKGSYIVAFLDQFKTGGEGIHDFLMREKSEKTGLNHHHRYEVMIFQNRGALCYKHRNLFLDYTLSILIIPFNTLILYPYGLLKRYLGRFWNIITSSFECKFFPILEEFLKSFAIINNSQWVYF